MVVRIFSELAAVALYLMGLWCSVGIIVARFVDRWPPRRMPESYWSAVFALAILATAFLAYRLIHHARLLIRALKPGNT